MSLWKSYLTGSFWIFWIFWLTRFSDTPKHRTQTQRRTLFPLFDETFDLWVQNLVSRSIHMIIIHIISFVSGAHKRRENAYLQILVKDRGLMGQGIFLGEAYLPLCEVSRASFNGTSSILINGFPSENMDWTIELQLWAHLAQFSTRNQKQLWSDIVHDLTKYTCQVEEENMDRPLQDLPQIQIPLTRPQDTGQLK